MDERKWAEEMAADVVDRVRRLYDAADAVALAGAKKCAADVARKTAQMLQEAAA